MAGTFLSRVQGFTPLIDVLAEELGLVTAAVYGVVWRYCQGPRGVCQASMERIAAHLNLDRRTVQRQIRRLVDEGYLDDLTPGLRNRPHTYADSGRAVIEGLVEARVYRRDGEVGVTESTTEVWQKVTPDAPRCGRKSHRGVAESTMKRERQDTEETIGDGVAAQPELALSETITEAARLWLAVRDNLQADMQASAYDTWIGDSSGISLEDGVLVVGVRSAYAKDWLENRLYGLIQRTVTAVAGRVTSVRFVVRRNER